MSRWMRFVSALLTAALLMALCIPVSLADGSDASASGLDIEYDVIEPDIGATDGDDNGTPTPIDAVDGDGTPASINVVDGDGTPTPASADDLAGTGLIPEGDVTAADPASDVAAVQTVPDPAGEGLSPAPVELPESEECVFVPEGGLDNEEAAAGFINKTLYEQPIQGRAMLRAAYANTAGNHLTGAELRLYNELKPLVIQVARGEISDTKFVISAEKIYSSADQKLSYTAAELGLSSFYENGQPSNDAIKKFLKTIAPDVQKVMTALLADCPYELFWFDKTRGIASSYASYQLSGETITANCTGTVYYKFTVASGYSATGEPETLETDAARIASIQTAAQNARKIIEDCIVYQDDLDKLTYYKNAVCSLADYNNDVDSYTLYGDPWQLIWVFDGDESTKVVCEGYSKAFQYLCDETNSFSSTVTVTSVTGYMYNDDDDGGRHMWNLVNYGGVNYMADLTNCDEGNAGYPDQLFMKGYSYVENNAWGDTYYFLLSGGKTLRYTFDNSVVNLYGKEDLQVSDDPVGPGGKSTPLGTSGLTWSVSNSGVLYIRGKGAIPNFTASGEAPWAGNSVKHVTLSNGITTIGDNAFTGCTNLTQVTIPPSVTSISDSAFDPSAMRGNCKGLVIQSCKSTGIINYAKRLQLNYTVNHGLAVTDKSVDATCTATGLTQGSHCSICNEVIVQQNIVPATGHKLTATAAKAATCAATGNIAYWTCATCKKYFSDKDGKNEITQAQTVVAKNANNHVGGTEIRNQKAATCKETGYTGDTYCKGCGVKTKSGTSIAKLTTHTPKAAVKENVVKETCGKAGSYDSVVYCSVCGVTLSREQKTVAATGNHTWSAWTTTQAATCTKAGSKTRKCAICTATEAQSIPATGHTWSAWSVTQAATCTKAGVKTRKCANCTATETQSIPATGVHTWGAWQTTQAATCTKAGVKTRKCSQCDKTETQSIPATGHTPVTVRGYGASCTGNGLTDGQKCSACGATLVAQQVIPAHGHYIIGVGGYPATYTSEGLTDGSYCGNCGATITPQQVIPRVYIRQVGLAKKKSNGTIEMSVGENLMLIPQFAQEAQVAVTGFTSSKPNLASVDGGGIVTALAEGKVKITVLTANKKVKANLTIKIVDPYKPTAVGIAQGKAVTISMGQSIQLGANLAPASARATLTWSSSKPNVAIVDANGVVIPQGEGKARITVTTHNKKKASVTVTVVDPNKPSGVSIAQGKAVTIKVGQSIHLDAVLAPASAQSALTWKSSKPAIALVDGAGNVTAVKKGKAKITVITYNKKKATIAVNVVG